jgi:hypothetical protein
MQKNFFLKWIYQLEGKKTDIIDHLREIIHVDIVKNSIDKFKNWRKKEGGAIEKDFDRHRRGIERKFYPNGNIAKEIHGLNQEMVNFLILDEHKTSELLKHKTLFDAANRYNFPTEYFYHLEKRKEINNTQKHRSLDYWYEQFKINYHIFFHPEFIKHKYKTNINYETYESYTVLQNIWSDLQNAILIHKLRVACEIRSWRWLYNDTFEDFNFDEINRDIEQFKKGLKKNDIENTGGFDNFNAILIYTELFEWLALDKLEDIEGFSNLKTKVIKNISLFPNDEQVAILIMLINYIITLFFQKKRIGAVKKVLFEVASCGFNERIFLVTYIDSNLFLNIFDLLQEDYPDFTNDMFSKYSTCIIPSEKLFVELFCMARMTAHKEDWYKALEYAEALEHYNNYTFAFRRGILTIEFQYEIKELWRTSYRPNYLEGKKEIDDEDIKDTCESFYNSLSLTKFHKKPKMEEKVRVLNLIKGVKTLLGRTISIDEVESALAATPRMMAYDWFKSKVELRIKGMK